MKSVGAAAIMTFTCRRCGRCCQGSGGVWVNASQLESLSSHLGVELGFLTADLLEADGRLWAVKTGPDGFCLFYDQGSKACRIHPVKPLSCRSWPYYRTILENPGCFSEAKEICEALSDWNHSAFLIAFRALNLPLPPRSLKKASLEV